MSSTTSTSFLIKFLQVVLLLYIAIEPAKAGNIEVCARSAEDTQHPVSGADVVCWDDDTWSDDDWMASGTTGSDGCALLSYSTKTNRRWYHCKAWDDCWGNPDIYCEVSGTCLQPTSTPTKNNFNQANTAYFDVNVATDSDFCEENYGWNGCGPSSIPDFLTDIASDVAGFRDACNKHDVCYVDCNRPRQQCEDEFKSNMYAECDDYFLCEFLADLYAAGVTELGGEYCAAGRAVIGCTSEQVDSCNL